MTFSVESVRDALDELRERVVAAGGSDVEILAVTKAFDARAIEVASTRSCIC